MLKVIVDSTPILPRPSGVGLYVKNLITALHLLSDEEALQLTTAYQPTFRAWVLGRPELRQRLAGEILQRRMNWPVRFSALLWGWLGRSPQLKSSLAATLDQQLGFPQIIHGTNYAVPPSHHARTILNIYDLTFVRYPQYADAMAQTYDQRVRHCLQWTDLVITVSESSKRDIMEYLGVAADRIWVTPLASQYASPEGEALNELSLPVLVPASTPISTMETSAQSRELITQNFNQKLNPQLNQQLLEKPFLLFVSTIEPRKNITNLIKGFNILKDSYHIDHNLVLIGKKGWRYGPIFEEIEQSPWRSQIFHLDYLPDEQLQQFYRHADVFLYPSHYEGFGLPILEAMAFGVPVVTANTSSLPEVGGDAALYVDPQRPEAIAHQVFRILDDGELKQQLVHRGWQQNQRFSWEATARETLRAYRAVS